MMDNSILKRTARDFASKCPVKWCPGCGDFAVLAQMQRTFANMDLPHEKFAVISGIGCSSRLPYYLNTYGFHTIHGRAPAVATGVKLANPDLSVWVVTGDGDALSIGGNHTLHAIRKNIGIKIILLNNRIYALTKGQSSPTTKMNVITKSSPSGTIDYPFTPLRFAIGLDCTFVARVMDTDMTMMAHVFEAAAKHEGTAFVEIFQRCLAFTNVEFDHFKDRTKKEDIMVHVEHGKPLVFGKNKDKGIVIKNFKAEVIEFEQGKVPPEVVVYDESNTELAYVLSGFFYPDMPVPVGILKNVEKPAHEELMHDKEKEAGDITLK
ncbi:MAG: 2-oxoacid:ferredoxin oxidoreductase subunit beta, partial [Elusimicrobiales bacterium]|nr:2-oxoacid:ferredoxin oxidoreductase subunit beta [Elusimicrobiales bacterium]